jgi:hypothetical protein
VKIAADSAIRLLTVRFADIATHCRPPPDISPNEATSWWPEPPLSPIMRPI